MRLKIRKLDGGYAIAQVDPEDFGRVAMKAWTLRRGYAIGNTTDPTRFGPRVRKGKGRDRRKCRLRMHRFVLGLSPDDPDVDHINRDKLDCRRLNLRLDIGGEVNRQNRNPNRATRGSTMPQSAFRGVHWDPSAKRWKASVQGKVIGWFSDDQKAAKVAAAERRRVMPYSEMDRQEGRS